MWKQVSVCVFSEDADLPLDGHSDLDCNGHLGLNESVWTWLFGANGAAQLHLDSRASPCLAWLAVCKMHQIAPTVFPPSGESRGGPEIHSSSFLWDRNRTETHYWLQESMG